ncbi:MAG: 4Fe-4S binding protein [Candidatus Sifarchaeia archaeon]
MGKEWDSNTIEWIKNFERWNTAITIPVNVEIKAEHKILNLDQAIRYLDNAQTIYLSDCICRTTMGNCDSSVRTCIAWDSAKPLLDTDVYKNQNTQEITKKEAFEILRMSHEAGLVHMAYAMWDDKVNRICSCCDSCCAIFASVLKLKMYPELITTETIEVTDMSLCDNSGVCVDRCNFGAREIVDGKLKVNHEQCYGCGVCVSTCPTGAISLVMK